MNSFAKLSLVALLIATSKSLADDVTTQPVSDRKTLQDGSKTFVIEVDSGWKVNRAGQSRGIVIGLHRSPSQSSPGQDFLIAENAGTRDLDKEAAHAAAVDADASDPKKPIIDKVQIDGEDAEKITLKAKVNEVLVNRVVYVVNHGGRSYRIVHDEIDRAGDSSKDLEMLMKSFRWSSEDKK